MINNINMYWKPSGSEVAITNTQFAKRHYYSQSYSQINTHARNKSIDLESTLPDTSIIKNTTYNQSQQIPQTTPPNAQKNKNNNALQTKKYLLTKILITRMINVRLALKKFQQLPFKIFQASPNYDISKELIFKTKLNLETSVLRTLIFADQTKTQIHQKMKVATTNNLFVLPTKLSRNKGSEKAAIMQLAQILKQPIRDASKKFKEHLQNQKCLSRYFAKMCARYEQFRSEAFAIMKRIPDRSSFNKTADKATQLCLTLLWKSWEARYTYNTRAFMTKLISFTKQTCLKEEHAARRIVLCSKVRKQQAFHSWLALSKMPSRRKNKQFVITEDKIKVLQRIVLRNYMKIFRDSMHKVRVFKKVAIRLGCNSHINEQKALWRLVNFSQRQ